MLEIQCEYPQPFIWRGLVTAYGDTDLDQHWLSYCHIHWRDKALTLTNVELSSVNSDDIEGRVV